MTTATTTTAINHTTTAGFRVWVAEIIAQLLAVGLTQTTDTGQINTATVARPGVNTSGGYAIFRFNDTSQSASPIFMRIEFGTGGSANNPQMWITVGTSTNGAGTITGTALDRVAMCADTAPTSTATTYISRFCYSATMGFLGMAWKISSFGTTGLAMGGFFVFRSTNSSGVVTTDAAMLLTNGQNASGSSGNPGYMQAISYLNSTAYSSAVVGWPSSIWSFIPFSLTSTLFSSNEQVFPMWQYTPVIGISASCCIAIMAEIGLGSTITIALIGATTHTYIQVQGPFGSGTLGSLSASTYGIMMLWE